MGHVLFGIFLNLCGMLIIWFLSWNRGYRHGYDDAVIDCIADAIETADKLGLKVDAKYESFRKVAEDSMNQLDK